MVAEFEKSFIARLNNGYPEVMGRIKKGEFDDEITNVLRKVAEDISVNISKA